MALFSCHFAACRRFATARVRLGPHESLTGLGLSSHVLPEGRDAGGWPSCTVAWQQIAGVGASCTPHGGATHDLGLRVHLTEGRCGSRALVYTSRRGAAGVEPWCTPHEAMLRDLRPCRTDGLQENAGRLPTRFQRDLMQRILPQMSCTRGPTPASRPCDVHTKAQLPQPTGRGCTRGSVSRSVTSRAYPLSMSVSRRASRLPSAGR